MLSSDKNKVKPSIIQVVKVIFEDINKWHECGSGFSI